MIGYGVQLDNLAIRKDYKALNLIAQGESVKNGSLTLNRTPKFGQ